MIFLYVPESFLRNTIHVFFLPVYIADKRIHHLSQKNGEHVHIIMKIARSICAGNGMRRYYTRITHLEFLVSRS